MCSKALFIVRVMELLYSLLRWNPIILLINYFHHWQINIINVSHTLLKVAKSQNWSNNLGNITCAVNQNCNYLFIEMLSFCETIISFLILQMLLSLILLFFDNVCTQTSLSIYLLLINFLIQFYVFHTTRIYLPPSYPQLCISIITTIFNCSVYILKIFLYFCLWHFLSELIWSSTR